ncbi:protein lifeguard 2-like isoform X1 [Ornithodoros turicata]|uniref:protein lifeguard 2-like isoform X1 n=1 Tax=Ornithodoros turicata TaxID=34597 RepID=UPI00313A1E33
MDRGSSMASSEEATAVGNPFSNKAIRRAFVRKVYLILSVQLLMTCAVISLTVFEPHTNEWVKRNPGFGMLSLLLSFFILIPVQCCCPDVLRSFPCNFIILFLFTATFATATAFTTAAYDTHEVLLAAAITGIVFISLTIFAMQSAIDFTALNGIMFCFLITLLLFGILVIFLGKTFPILRLVYSCLGALLFSVYIIVDTQLIMGGERKLQISPEDYITACLMLYLDVINLFLHILQIIREVQKD